MHGSKYHILQIIMEGKVERFERRRMLCLHNVRKSTETPTAIGLFEVTPQD